MLLPAIVLSLSAASAFAAGASQTPHASISCETPEFPVHWQDDGDSGTVTLAVLVGEDGRVMASRLLSSSGIARVDRASLKASAKCRFQPAAKDKQSMPAWTRIQYTWVVD